MKQLLATAKAMVGLLTLCALMAFALPIDAYAFPAKDVPIVMYHKVDAETPTVYWVSDDDFRDQMFLLHDLGYDTVDFDDLYNHIQDVTELPAKPIIVTFDDGYEGIYTYALPVMQEFTEPNFFGVAHITTDIIGDDEASRQLNLWDQPPEPDAWQMIWPEVTALYDAGWAIEAHSRTHAHLGGLSYEEKVYEAGAAAVIASSAGIPAPNFYCYPFGESDSELITILQQAGYLGAMDASGGIENTSTTNLFHIRRIGIMREDSLDDFAGKIGESMPALPTLTINTDGNGSVLITPDQPYYDYGTVVTLTAVGDPGYLFTGWSSDLTGSNNPDTITMDADKTVTATFVFNDTEAPIPDPMMWGTASPPAPTGPTSISMTATTASDVSGVEYYFACVGGGGNDSGWQDSATYEDTGLSPDTQYTYTVTARDLSVNQNTTASSTAESATTDAGCIAYTTHVESIVFNNRVRCAPARYNGQVVVTVYDNCGDPVANADVTGTFTGDFSGTLSQTTDASGVAVITAEGCVKKPAYQFCVDNITHASLTYASGDNVETCDTN